MAYGGWARFLRKVLEPFRILRRFPEAFRKGKARGRGALLAGTAFLGGGRFFTGEIGRGLLLLLLETGAVLYYVFFGIPLLQGKISYPKLGLEAVSVILVPVLLYFYLRELALILLTVEREEYREPRIPWFFAELRSKLLGYFRIWKEASPKERFELASPFFLMGYFQFRKRAYVKGAMLFLVEVGFIFYLAATGIYDLVDFVRLETDFRPSTFNLVYGFVAFAVILVFLNIYIKNIKSVTKAVKGELAFKPFKEEIREFLDNKLYATFLAFPVLGVILFTIVPLVFMISIAFTGYEGASQNFVWTGFQSFKNLVLVRDNLYTLLSVTRWTLIWAFFATFTNYFGGMFLAMLINKKGVKGKKFWRTVFIITMAVPQFVSLLIMNQMFAYDGPVNQFLLNLGLIKERINFWGVQTRARILIILINMWVGIPYLMLLTSGILMNIPNELYEAAIIEGANKWQLFTKVTMPYMLFVTTPLLVTGFVGNINNFNVIYLLTGGKPLGVGLVNAGGTDILITWLYQLTKTHRMYNLSAAIGIIIFLLSASISLIIYRNTASYKGEGRFK